ncbi:hypothetical protein Tco_1428425 [Tanacetum coccineum]
MNYSFDLETFRDMLQFCPNLPGQKFEDPPFEEDILAFIRELGYPRDINGKATGLDQLRLSRAQIICGMYNQKKVDYVYLAMHEVVQKYDAILPDTLTNQAMKESEAYKTYYTFASGKEIPKPKYVRRSTDQAPTTSPGKRLKATGKHVYLRVQTPSHFESNDDETYDEVTQGDNVEGEELDEEETNEEEEVNELYRDVNVNLEGRDTEMTDALLANVQTTQVIEDTYVIIIAITPEVQQQSSSVSSGFISNMLNPNLDTCIDSILNLNNKSTSLVDVPVITNVEMPPSSITTLPQPPIPLIQPLHQTPVPTLTIVPSTSLQNLPTFSSLFKFEDRVKSLEDDFSEFKQTNLFAEAVSSIPGIVDTYLANKMNEAVKTAVQLQSDRLRDEAQAENEDFINKLDENIKKIIKEQVKEQVTKILPRIEKSVNEQLEAEVLIRSSNEAKTSHAVVANLSELELKKILIDKMENNKLIDRSFQQKNLYKALVDAYESEKDILATYGDTVTLKRHRDDEDEDEEPSPGSNRGSKRRRPGKEPESTSAPKEKTSKSSGKSKEGYPNLIKSVLARFTEDQPIDETTQHPDWFQKPTKPPTPNRDWNKTLLAKHGPVQPWIITLAQNEDPRESFNELMDTPLNFSTFVLNRLKVNTLTLELLAESNIRVNERFVQESGGT